MSGQTELAVRPIGRVTRTTLPAAGPGGGEGDAEIEVDPEWAGALDGIEGFSHLWLVWWLGTAAGSDPLSLHVHPERRPDMPLVGVFATRSPQRPNPIAITAVRLVERQGTRLRVRGLDAFQETPILDIKPYLLRGDAITGATGPEWIDRLWCIHDEEARHVKQVQDRPE